MNKILTLSLFLPLILCASDNKKLYAEYFGHVLWERSLKETELDFQDILNGMKEASEKIPAKISDEEAYRIVLELEKEKLQQRAEKNLQQSITFLREIVNESGVIPIIPDKVYIKIIQEGSGDGLSRHETGWFKLKAYRPDQKPFYENNEGVMQSLDAAIEGFSKGALGMKVGEKRIIYMHPEYAYGIHMSKPNTVVIAEAERIANK